MIRVKALFVLLLSVALAVAAQSPTTRRNPAPEVSCNEDAEAAMELGDYGYAKREFELALKVARERGESRRVASCHFYIGLIAHKQALNVEAPRRRDLLVRASQSYEASLALDPDRLLTLVRLLEVVEELGDTKRAASLRDRLKQLESPGVPSRGTLNMANFECIGAPTNCGSEYQSFSPSGDDSDWAPARCRVAEQVEAELRRGSIALAAHTGEVGGAQPVLLRSAWQSHDDQLRLPESGGRCRRISLDPAPSWSVSGAWSQEGDLLLTDPLRNQVLRYDMARAGRPKSPQLDRSFCSQFAHPAIIQSVKGGFLLQDRGNFLIRLNESFQPVWALNVAAGASNSIGQVTSIASWVPVGSSILSFGDIKLPDGKDGSGIFEIPLLSAADFRLVFPMSLDDPARDFYFSGAPYTAEANGKGYFLVMNDKPAIYPVSAAQAPQSGLRPLAAFPEGLSRPSLPRIKDDLDSVRTYLDALQGVASPAGLYGSNGFLYLLARQPKDKVTMWTLTKIDPERENILGSWPLPTEAEHLIAVPGPDFWGFIEKEKDSDQKLPAIRSVLLIPSRILEGAGAATNLCAGGVTPAKSTAGAGRCSGLPSLLSDKTLAGQAVDWPVINEAAKIRGAASGGIPSGSE